jgi:hypothetical protein
MAQCAHWAPLLKGISKRIRADKPVTKKPAATILMRACSRICSPVLSSSQFIFMASWWYGIMVEQDRYTILKTIKDREPTK